MLSQDFINLASGTIIAVVGWVARELWAAVKELRQDLGKLREELPQHYVLKTDFHTWSNAIMKKLDRIEEKLDNKKDKGPT